MASQPTDCSGIVTDEEGQPVEGVAVTALNLPDSTFIAASSTGADGKYMLDFSGRVAPQFLIRIEGIGYETAMIPGTSGPGNDVKLISRSLTLGKVSVVAKPRFEAKGGSFVFYPGELSRKVPDAFSILKYTPLLIVDESAESVSLVGKDDMKIYVNGRPSIMSSRDVLRMLKASDGPRIKKIEIKIQPGIEHRSDVPILDIYLAPRTGRMGYARANASYSNRFAFQEGGWMGWERENRQFSLGATLIQLFDKTRRIEDYTKYLNDDPANGAEYTKDFSSCTQKDTYYFTANAGASVDFGHKNYMGATVLFTGRDTRQTSHDITDFAGTYPSLDLSTDNRMSFRPSWVLGRLVYNHKTDTLGGFFMANFEYSHHDNGEKISYSPVDAMRAGRFDNLSENLSLDVNWLKGCSEKMNFSIGFSDAANFATLRSLYAESGILQGPLTMTDNLHYFHNEFDLIARLGFNPSSTFSLNLGARMRRYDREIEQRVEQVTRKFHHYYFLPQMSAGINISPMHIISVAYNVQVSHPDVGLLNPVVRWNTPYYCFSGNPDLQSSVQHNVNLYYMLLQSVTLGATASFANHQYSYVNMPEDNGVTHFMPIETGKLKTWRLFASYNKALWDYRLRLNARAEWSRYDYSNTLPASLAPGKTRNSQWHLSADPSVFLGADRSWSFSLGASYNSRNKKPLFTTRSNFDINLGATKRFPFGGTVSLNIYNILDHTPLRRLLQLPVILALL